MKYKYKKHIATGVLAFSLLISGTNVFAATPQDLGIKNSGQVYQKQNKKIKTIGKSKIVGTIGSINSNGFVLEIKNKKTKIISSLDVSVGSSTTYNKNGNPTTISDITIGQKVIIVGNLDKTTNILTAKTVKIAS